VGSPAKIPQSLFKSHPNRQNITPWTPDWTRVRCASSGISAAQSRNFRELIFRRGHPTRVRPASSVERTNLQRADFRTWRPSFVRRASKAYCPNFCKPFFGRERPSRVRLASTAEFGSAVQIFRGRNSKRLGGRASKARPCPVLCSNFGP